MKKIVCILILFVAGCGKGIYLRSPFTTEPPIVIHIITPDDIFAVPKGAQVEWKDDLMFVQKDGWFVSDDYMQEVMKAKVE